MKEKKLIKNIVFYTVKQICAVIFPMLIYPYITRVLGVDNLGKVEYAKSIVQYFVILAGLGISDYAIREGSRLRNNKNKLNQFSTQIFFIHVVSTIIAMIGVIILSLTKPFLNYRILLFVFMLIIPFNLIGTEWIFGINENYKYISVRTIVFQILSFIFIFCFIHSQQDYIKYAIILIVSSVGANVLNIPIARKYFKIDFSNFEVRKHLKPIFFIFGMTVAGSFYTTMDTSMLGLLVGTVSVGYYTAANKLVNLISTFVGAIRTVLLPRLSYSVGVGDEESFKRINGFTLKVILMFAIPIAGGILCLSEDIILLFCGDSFLPSAIALRLLVPEIVLSAINGYLVYQILLPLKEEKKAFICVATGAFVNLLSNLIFIPIMKQNGAALATWISELFVLIMVFVLAFENILNCINIKSLCSSIVKYSIAGILMMICCFIVSNLIYNNVIRLFVTIFVGICIYGITLIILKDDVCNALFKMFRRN